jgi:hypothetical protein
MDIVLIAPIILAGVTMMACISQIVIDVNKLIELKKEGG